MKYSVQTTAEDGAALLVGDDGGTVSAAADMFECPAREGMVFELRDGRYYRDADAENSRRQEAASLLDKLLGGSENR